MEKTAAKLKEKYNDLDKVWFFVSPDYKIISFNEKAMKNSIALHGRELNPKDSILDYARDTQNRVDGDFIANFGKASTGRVVHSEQEVAYESVRLWVQSEFTPIFDKNKLLGISILVEEMN
ncbi:MAG: hypothetical protein K0S09_2557 [Sphingobacteriaceae bacterium]|jgi:hypothetical protein|nr:hypothetical protein [Sphingobacteriaceae bacterium]